MADPEHKRLIEALLFASAEPLDEAALASRLPDGAALPEILDSLAADYAGRGVNLVRLGGRWMMRTAPDLAFQLRLQTNVQRKPSRAAVETLAIIAYHQPVTRHEIEEIRGVALSKGTLDLLFEAGWVQPKGRRNSPGRPVTWVTTDAFLTHFGLGALDELPGIEELKAAGLLERRPGLTTLAMRPEEAAEGGDEEEEAG